jgi:glutathione peroxidase
MDKMLNRWTLGSGLAVAFAAATVCTPAAQSRSTGATVSSFYDLKTSYLDGKPADLAAFRGKVALVVNVASKCGFTPQYKGLEALYEKLHARGLEVLGFPCNQFGAQEPGSNKEIKTFCSDNYSVTFPLFDKLHVKGPSQHPLYTALTGKDSPFPGDVKWNFGKFLIGRDGGELEPRHGACREGERDGDGNGGGNAGAADAARDGGAHAYLAQRRERRGDDERHGARERARGHGRPDGARAGDEGRQGGRLHQEVEGQRCRSIGADRMVSHDGESGVAALGERIRGVGERVEVQRPGDRGTDGEADPGGDERGHAVTHALGGGTHQRPDRASHERQGERPPRDVCGVELDEPSHGDPGQEGDGAEQSPNDPHRSRPPIRSSPSR